MSLSPISPFPSHPVYYNQGSLSEGSGRGALKFLDMDWLTLVIGRLCLPICSLVLCPVPAGELSRRLPSLFGRSHLTVSLPLKSLQGCQCHLVPTLLEETWKGQPCVKPKLCALAQFNKNLCSGMRSTSPAHTNQMGHVSHFLLSRGSLSPSRTSHGRESKTGFRYPESSSQVTVTNTPKPF